MMSTGEYFNASLLVDRNLEAGRGDKPAYLATDGSLTFAELARQVNRMGGLLNELGVKREQRVLLVLDDTTLFPIAFLGAMRIGAVPVPVSVLETPERQRHFLEDSYAEMVVCDAERLPILRQVLDSDRRGAANVRCLVPGIDEHGTIELLDALAAQESELTAVSTHPEDMAFWLYSSGSTGHPKGVVHAHRSIEVTCQTFAREVLAIEETDTIFSTTKLHHAYGLGNALSFPLYFGATAVLLDGPPRPERLLRILREHAPTVFFSVPALYGLLAEDLGADEAFSRTRLCVSAAEPLPPSTFDRWQERFGLEIVEGIGSTEMLQAYCSNRPGEARRGVTGRPVPGYELRLTDEDGVVLEGAGAGELQVRGDSRALAYWHASTEAMRRLRGEWYASGDRFERRGEDTYVYLGRVDDTFKVGGLWVSPLEMEQAMLEHPLIDAVGVVGVAHRERSWIVAFVECAISPESEQELARELRSLCAKRLREHESPHIVRIVEALPRTPTGKPQRFKLRELAALEMVDAEATVYSARAGDDDGDGRASAGGVLELVLEQLAGVLGRGSSGDLDPSCDFKRLGLDSIGAIQLRNRLSQLTGLDLPSTLAFDHPTPATVASLLCSERDGLSPAPGIARHRRTHASGEPIAIVGMSCRFPGGVDSPERLWQLIASSADAISGFPQDRGWQLESLHHPDPEHRGTSYVRHGGFLPDAAEFDAGFFGIGPREALAIDPQHRLLLEASWEALERANIVPESLRGTDTGVYAGVMYHDYGERAGADSFDLEAHLGVGSAGSVASGRIAYTLGLEGPAVTLDTACSSSLVALHLACNALRAGECETALAGGVTVLSTPRAFVEFSRQRGLAPDGRCKPYADSADGTSWSEGVGVLVLERLSQATRRGHRVLALVRGSAINQDGASNGLTAPNGPAQQRVIARALADARLTASQIDLVEGHGTGTALGDPIEAQALIAAYGRDRRPDHPLWLGSVKSNIGHTQAAAGMAGVIKTVMAMRNGRMPKSLYADRPSEKVDWSAGTVALLAQERLWPGEQEPRRAAVSSFGISGTNAHVILEEAAGSEEAAGPQEAAGSQPSVPQTEPDTSELLPIPISAKTETSLRAQAERLGAGLEADTDLSHVGVAHTLACARTTSFSYRALALADGRASLLDALRSIGANDPAAAVIEGVAPARAGKLAFLFSGQGAQRAGMGRELYERFPVFGKALDEVRAHLDPLLERPLLDVMFDRREQTSLDRTSFTQPALFALELALYRLVRSFGLRPDFVMGHSVGELAAAHVAGVLELADACALVAARGRLMAALPAGGAMVAVQLCEQEVAEELAAHADSVALAALNGPSSVVISGDEAPVLALAERWREMGRKTKRLNVSHAFHSARMEPMLEDFRKVAAELTFHEPQIPLVSNLSGRLLSSDQLDEEYWVRHAREPVRFAEGVRLLGSSGVDRFLELGPDGVLSAMVANCLGSTTFGPGAEDKDEATVTDARDEAAGDELEQQRSEAQVVPLLRAGQPETRALLGGLGEAWASGAPVDWAASFAGRSLELVELPTYAFQRERYWLDARPRSDAGSDAGEASGSDGLYRLDWLPLPPVLSPPREIEARGIALIGSPDSELVTVLADSRGPFVCHSDVGSLCEELVQESHDHAWDVVLPWHTDPGPALPGGAGASLCKALDRARSLLGERALRRCRLVLVTRRAVSAAPGEDVCDLVAAPVWGLLRAAQSEHPGRFAVIDIDDDRVGLGEALLSALASDEPQLAIRRGEVLGPAMARAGTSHAKPFKGFDAGGTVLVTGGTGSLGSTLARHLVARHGARRLLLVSRSGASAPLAERAREELEELGAEVRIAACDVSDREQLEALIASLDRAHPLCGVVHAAGTLDDAVIDTLTPEQIRRVLAPKLDAAWHLHELTSGMDLQAFVLFSSVASTFGAPGQGNYAAANSFLEALAAHRHAQRLPALAVAWGAWQQDTGMTSGLAGAEVRRLAQAGVLPLTPDHGLELFDAALACGSSLLVAARLDFSVLRQRAASGELSGALRGLVDPATLRVGRAQESGKPLAARFAAAAAAQRKRVVLDFVNIQTAAILGHASPKALEPGLSFKDLGFDSLAAVELRNRLERATGLELSATLVFDHPQPAELAAHLSKELVAAEAATAPSAEPGPSAASAPSAALGLSDGAGSSRTARTSEGAVDPRRTRRAPEDLGNRHREPIAIVGIGCRYPGGARGAEGLWRLVDAGIDGIGPFPSDRGWELDGFYDPELGADSASYVREGGFLHDATRFDAAFFGISPREALSMDPQQRLLLETCWEACEHATIDPHALRGTPTGVFVGIGAYNYDTLVSELVEDPHDYRLTGNAVSVASGRVAYTLGLEGPAISIDTACSSSLVALHLACRSLRQGECTTALAGGVTVMSLPEVFIDFSRQQGLAPDARCKSFAEAADGTAWSEGVGMLVLERLSDAHERGHRVLALVRGSAVNQDGASNGLTAPSRHSQQRVIEEALLDAGLSAGEVDVVEAHGTGTRLGDPIEAQALLAVHAHRDPATPLLLGSVKSNIGHSQAAAGVGGVIKMAMALRHERLPKTLHVDAPSSEVNWSSGAISLLTEPQPWLRGDRPRHAGVSSFGISGTNAHVILEEAPTEDVESHRGQGKRVAGGLATTSSVLPPGSTSALASIPWALSARTELALCEQADQLVATLRADPELDPRDVGLSLGARAQFEQRAVVLGEDRESLLGGLETLALPDSAAGGRAAEVMRGVARGEGGTAFLFSGQGSQRPGMGRELYEASRVFRDAFDEACSHFDGALECSLSEIVFETAGDPGELQQRLDRTRFAQCGLFALELGLWRLLDAWGVRPEFLIGHSVGELVAAHVAGVFSLQDACRVVAARGLLMDALPAGGAMLALAATEQELEPWLDAHEENLALAAVNGHEAVVLSGEREAVLEAARTWERRGHKTKLLQVSHAFHSPRMNGMLAEFGRVLETVSFSEPELVILSNLTGLPVEPGQLCSPAYWVSHARETVRFADGVRWLLAQGATRFLELGPKGVLSAMVQDCPVDPESHDALVALPTLRGDRPEVASLLSGLAGIWVTGGNVEWPRAFDGCGARATPLPSYPFQRRRFWLQANARSAGDPLAVGQTPTRHPLLGALVERAADGGALITGRLSLSTHPWLADHVVTGRIVAPGTALLEMVLHAGAEVGCTEVRELTLQAPLTLEQERGVQVQLTLSAAQESGEREIALYSRPVGSAGGSSETEAWECHATGALAVAQPEAFEEGDASMSGPWPPADATPLDAADLYQRLAERGLHYGAAFQGLQAAWSSGRDICVEVELPPDQLDAAARFAIHPALLDSALHALALVPESAPGAQESAQLPFSWSDVSVFRPGVAALRVRLSPQDERTVALVVADKLGKPVAKIGALSLRDAPAPGSSDRLRAVRDALFVLDWTVSASALTSTMAPSSPPIVLGGNGKLAMDIANLAGDVEWHADLTGLEAVERDEGHVPELIVLDCVGENERSAPAERLGELARARAGEALELLQGCLASEPLGAARLVVVTREAVAAAAHEDLLDLPGSAIWGLVRSAQSEHPGRIWLLDLDDSELSRAALLSGLGGEEPQLAIRRGTALTPRLRPAIAVGEVQRPADEVMPAFDRQRTVLISGGTSGLGALVARRLVIEHGVRSVLLASRRGVDAPDAGELCAELRDAGALVTIATCDVAELEQVRGLIDMVPAEHPLGAVVHAAGVLDDCLIEELTRGSLDQVFAPKIDGALNLHTATAQLKLDAFVLFSSAASALGTPGQGNYAAANAFLDALAVQRRTQGLAGVSIAWGPWEQQTGLTRGLGESGRARIARSGMRTLPTEQGLVLFEHAARGSQALVIAMAIDRAVLRVQAAAARTSPLLDGLTRPAPGDLRSRGESLAKRLSDMDHGEREQALLALTIDQVRAVLGLTSADDIDGEQAFKELGFDSLTVLELRNRLDAETGLRLPATLAFDHPNASAVARYILDRLASNDTARSPRVDVELDELERRLSTLAEREGAQAQVAARLGDLLARLGPVPVAESHEDLQAATASEIFDLIDRELGPPESEGVSYR